MLEGTIGFKSLMSKVKRINAVNTTGRELFSFKSLMSKVKLAYMVYVK